MKRPICWMVLCAVVLLSSAGLPRSQSLIRSSSAHTVAAAQPTGLAVVHRSGQTFITWNERADLAGERYRVYRHTQPITSATLAQASLLYDLAEGSGNFYSNRYRRYADDGSEVWQARYVDRFVINNRGNQLAAGTGLLVWTLSAEEIAAGGSGYYAVTTVDSAGAENRAEFSAGNATGPVAESVSDPLPVELAVDAGLRGHIFVQYMNIREWNPTFHAPHAGNVYYGLNPANPAVSQAVQYAYDYAIYEPDEEVCGGPVPARVPVIMNLHPWYDNFYDPMTYEFDYWCAFRIYPIDMWETWYYGFVKEHDFRQNTPIAAGDVAVNYTEQRLLRMLYDLGRHPTFGARVDAKRVYVFGQSMGGGGALAFAMRYPNVFAAAYASQPTTNYRTRGPSFDLDWVEHPAQRWGTPGLNLPVEIDAPGGWADHLQRFNGTGVWDWQNHQANLQSRIADEMAPLGIGHSVGDTILEWSTQGQPTYPALNASRRAWGGAIVDTEHAWMEFNGLPPTLGLDESSIPFDGLTVVRDESVPGLSNASGNSPLPPTAPGGYNLTLDWSASWNAWDEAPVDTVDEWRISLRTTDDSNQTVDVTPRRLQTFRVSAGRTYAWENRRVSDDRVIASGTVTAASGGVVTVPNFAVTGDGNRLVLRPVDQVDSQVYLPLVLK